VVTTSTKSADLTKGENNYTAAFFRSVENPVDTRSNGLPGILKNRAAFCFQITLGTKVYPLKRKNLNGSYTVPNRSGFQVNKAYSSILVSRFQLQKTEYIATESFFL
jgi:hypothetical protein